MKNQVLKISTLLVLLGVTTPQSWGATEFSQNLATRVDSVVEINLLPCSNSGSIDAKTGVLSPIQAKFELKTNSDDSDYEFMLHANIKTRDGESVNAYFGDGRMNYIILANTTNKPDAAGISNIKNAPSNTMNKNAIAYHINTSSTGSSKAVLAISPQRGGHYYDLTKGEDQSVTFTQTISGSPYSNTYSLDTDSPGTYEALITLSANRKP